MKIAALFILLLFSFASCKGQKAIQPANGNSATHGFMIGDTVANLSESIMVVFQDKKNNYWFGSRYQGAFRYDGKVLLQFTKEDGLISNDIWGIQEDKHGNIYFDTQEGVSKFDGQTMSTLPIKQGSINDWKLGPDDLWFKGNWNVNGTYRFDGKTLTLLPFPEVKKADTLKADFPNMNWSPYGLYSLYKDKKGNMWFGTSNVGLYRYDGKHLSYMYEDQLTNTANGGSFGIRSMYEDKEGKFWFCNTQNRYTIFPGDSFVNGRSLIRYTTDKGMDGKAKNGDWIYYLSITEDDHGDLWMVTYDDGVWRYNGKDMTHYSVKDGAKETTLFSIYKDSKGDLWLGTHETGAYKFNGKTFEKFVLK